MLFGAMSLAVDPEKPPRILCAILLSLCLLEPGKSEGVISCMSHPSHGIHWKHPPPAIFDTLCCTDPPGFQCTSTSSRQAKPRTRHLSPLWEPYAAFRAAARGSPISVGSPLLCQNGRCNVPATTRLFCMHGFFCFGAYF